MFVRGCQWPPVPDQAHGSASSRPSDYCCAHGRRNHGGPGRRRLRSRSVGISGQRLSGARADSRRIAPVEGSDQPAVREQPVRFTTASSTTGECASGLGTYGAFQLRTLPAPVNTARKKLQAVLHGGAPVFSFNVNRFMQETDAVGSSNSAVPAAEYVDASHAQRSGQNSSARIICPCGQGKVFGWRVGNRPGI